MSPEQAKGKPVDRRADIWAFGVVLYEMLTGERLFQGEDITETIAAVVKEQPDLTRVPVQVRRLAASRAWRKIRRNGCRRLATCACFLDDAAPSSATSAAAAAWNRAAWVVDCRGRVRRGRPGASSFTSARLRRRRR